MVSPYIMSTFATVVWYTFGPKQGNISRVTLPEIINRNIHSWPVHLPQWDIFCSSSQGCPNLQVIDADSHNQFPLLSNPPWLPRTQEILTCELLDSDTRRFMIKKRFCSLFWKYNISIFLRQFFNSNALKYPSVIALWIMRIFNIIFFCKFWNRKICCSYYLICFKQSICATVLYSISKEYQSELSFRSTR